MRSLLVPNDTINTRESFSFTGNANRLSGDGQITKRDRVLELSTGERPGTIRDSLFR